MSVAVMGVFRIFICPFLLLLSAASLALDNGEFTYEAYQDGISITGCSTQCPTDLVIPSEIDGLNVLKLDNFTSQGIKKLTISENITHIEKSAFSSNPIEKLLLGPDVVSIGESAFYNNTTPPINVLFMGPRPVFKGCLGCGYYDATLPFNRRPPESEFYFCDEEGWSETSINTGTSAYGGGIQESELLINCDLDSDADGEIDFMDDDDDNDGVNDEIDAFPLLASETHDFDNDGIGDNVDTDSDNDGIDDELDAFPLDPDESSDSDADGIGDNGDSFPNNPEYFLDSDSDSMPDEWELQHGMNPNDPSDAILDQDNDGKSALQEFEDGTYPVPDADGDGVRDEIDLFPNDPAETIDTDGDGTGDNGDNCIAIGNPDQLNTDSDPLGNACDDDDDNDGIPDSYETANGLNPVDASDAQSDSDMDGLTALEEYTAGTSPTNDDTDRDTLPDGWEVENGRDPLVADYQIAVGYDHTCALDDTGVVCWGRNNFGQISVPDLNNISHLSLGASHSCTLSADGVICWGMEGDGNRSSPPVLINPSLVSSGGSHSCAIDDSGVVCWGFSGYGATTVPSLYNPSKLELGEHHSCAIDNTGVVCWGRNNHGQTDVPNLNNPIAVSAGGYHTCAIDDSGVVCWGGNFDGQTDVPELINSYQISLGVYHSCALDDSGVVCWGRNLNSQTDSPLLNSVSKISAGDYANCSLGVDGFICWGENGFNEINVPNLMIDPDGDGISNQNGIDAFPLDSTEWLDTDSDGIGNNTDLDDDNDGFEDALEIQNGLDPLVVNLDIDNDGIANVLDNDNDNDGALDHLDAFPLNSLEQLDSDLDGIGNKSDADNDNDGVMDVIDLFPLDPNESADSDGDGVGDNADFFPNSSEYSSDSDLDQMPDAWERKYGLNPTDASDAVLDHDGDGMTALEEYEAGTIPLKILDIDANGSVDALTDGLMVLRYLFGLRGQGLISNGTASDAMRTEAADIEAYIQSLMPDF